MEESCHWQAAGCGGVTALCLLDDGRLASGFEDHTIRLWNTRTGAQTARLEGHLGEVSALCVLSNFWLASGSSDETIRFWDLTTSTEIARLGGHSNKVNALSLVNDQRLVSGASDNTIRLWDIRTKREISRLEIDDPVLCLIALSDRRLVAGDRRGDLHWIHIVG